MNVFRIRIVPASKAFLFCILQRMCSYCRVAFFYSKNAQLLPRCKCRNLLKNGRKVYLGENFPVFVFNEYLGREPQLLVETAQSRRSRMRRMDTFRLSVIPKSLKREVYVILSLMTAYTRLRWHYSTLAHFYTIRLADLLTKTSNNSRHNYELCTLYNSVQGQPPHYVL